MKPTQAHRLLTLAVALILASCTPTGFADENFGLGAHITDRLGPASDAVRGVISVFDASVQASAVRGAFCCTDDEADINVALQDLDFDGRIDVIRFCSKTYERSAFAPGGVPGIERLGREYEEIEYKQLVEGFRAKYPGVKTIEGITLGSTYDEIRDAYEQEPLSREQVGMKRRVVYRRGNSNLIFVLIRGRVVQMVLVGKEYFDGVYGKL